MFICFQEKDVSSRWNQLAKTNKRVVNASYDQNGAWMNHEQQIENKLSQNSPWLELEEIHHFFLL
jgi:hypothetical protein